MKLYDYGSWTAITFISTPQAITIYLKGHLPLEEVLQKHPTADWSNHIDHGLVRESIDINHYHYKARICETK